jgi:hypothetical protein
MDSHASAQLAFGIPLRSRVSKLGKIFQGHSRHISGVTRPHHRRKTKHYRGKAPSRHHRGFVVPNELMKMMLYKAIFREMRD